MSESTKQLIAAIKKGDSADKIARSFGIEVDDAKELIKAIKGNKAGSTGSSFIEHAREQGGIRKGVKSLLEERNQESIKTKGRKSTFKTVSSIFFNEAGSEIISQLFDKKVKQEKKQEEKQPEKKEEHEITKEDLKNLQDYMSKNVSKTKTVSKKFNEIKEYMSKTLSKTKTVSKKFNEISDKIDNSTEQLEHDINDLRDAITEEVKSETAPNKIVKKVDVNGRTHYQDTVTKKFASKESYEAQQNFLKKTSKSAEGLVSGAGNVVTNKRSIINASTGIKDSIGTFGIAQRRSLTNIEKIVNELAKTIKQLIKSSNSKDAKEPKKVLSNKLADLKLEASPENPLLAEILGILKNQEQKQTEAQPAYNALAPEEDEKQSELEDALYDALKKIMKDHPEMFKGEGGGGGGILSILGGILTGGAVVKGLGAGAKSIVERFKGSPATTVAKEAAEDVGEKAAAKAGEKQAVKVGEKAAVKAGTKVAGKTVLKSVLKKIPIVGALAGLGFAVARAAKGDWTGAAMEAASGVASTIPGAGTAASLALDAGLAAKDMKEATKNPEQTIQKVEQKAEKAAPEVTKKAEQVVDKTTPPEIAKKTEQADANIPTLKPITTNTPADGTTQVIQQNISTPVDRKDPKWKELYDKQSKSAGLDFAKQMADAEYRRRYPTAAPAAVNLKPANPSTGQQLIEGNRQVEQNKQDLSNMRSTPTTQQSSSPTVVNNSNIALPSGDKTIRTSGNENSFNRSQAVDADHPHSAFNIG